MATTAVHPNDKFMYEPLLDTESSVIFFLAEPSVATISFFESANHKKSFEWMRERIFLICHANPWLVGRLVKDKKKHKNVLLAVPESITDNDIDAITCSKESDLSPISTKIPYNTVSKTVSKSNAMVPEGYKLVGKDTRVSKFTLVPVSSGETAFVMSITHAVVDGYTYYKIMSMLTDGAEIESLSFVRKHDFNPKMKQAIGEEEYKLLTSPSLALSMVSGMLCPKPAIFDARFVDEEKVKQAKKEATDRCGNIADDEFACSTNDILTSTFAKATNAGLLLMAINLRNRVKETNDKDAGNYEAVVTYDSPSSATPEAIRKSLRGGAPFKRVGGLPLPGLFKLMAGINFAMITNWAFPVFKADMKLLDESGEKNSSIKLHLPIENPAAVIFPVAIIFRPYTGKLAVLYAGSSRDLPHDRLISSNAPIGDKVNDLMFAE
mmetsp:Transcript_4717/g.5661  ORF Transcript_4717/g.5661 Transcript_4717/m.5661 type:complete len:437 (+) Transcript_4717:67-1377(+)